MTLLTARYLRDHIVHFEPHDLPEAENIQRKLFEMGYRWPSGKRVAYAGRCLSLGLTALPDGRLLCGLPEGVSAAPHDYRDFFTDAPPPAPAPPPARPVAAPVRQAAARTQPPADSASLELARLARLVETALDDSRTARVIAKHEVAQGFTALAQRLQKLEDGQKALADKVDRLTRQLAPPPLEIKKTLK